MTLVQKNKHCVLALAAIETIVARFPIYLSTTSQPFKTAYELKTWT